MERTGKIQYSEIKKRKKNPKENELDTKAISNNNKKKERLRKALSKNIRADELITEEGKRLHTGIDRTEKRREISQN